MCSCICIISVRNDPTNNCDDGLCPNGPYPSRGMMWMCYITTNADYGDVTPFFPTSSGALVLVNCLRSMLAFDSQCDSFRV